MKMRPCLSDSYIHSITSIFIIFVFNFVSIYLFSFLRMALRNRVKAIVMFAGVIKHRLNRTNTANILARLEDTMS